MVSLGGWGAVIVWLISVCLGALHNVIYCELAAMFPDKAGGIAFYAHEAWKRYLSFIGPMAAFGYWIGWSVVLAVNGVIVGGLLQAEFFEGTAAEGSSWNHTVDLATDRLHLQLPDLRGHRAGLRDLADQLPRRAAGRVGRLRDAAPCS